MRGGRVAGMRVQRVQRQEGAMGMESRDKRRGTERWEEVAVGRGGPSLTVPGRMVMMLLLLLQLEPSQCSHPLSLTDC